MKKKLRPGLLCLVLLTSFIVNGQTINWSNLKKEQKNLINVNIGADYALIYGIGYSYQVRGKQPAIFSVEYSFPSGNDLFDDFKIKTGGQVRWLQSDNFHFTLKLYGIFRRYHNSYARLLNFGTDLSTTAGYYRNRWFAAAEIGFDKAIITHFKHSDLYKENYPQVKDGWYEPSTGGNFYYGILTGYSFKRKDVFIKFGKRIEQDFETSPMLPVYAQLGVNIKIQKAAKGQR